MIKSFFKKVFSSSSEVSAAAETPQKEVALTETIDQHIQTETNSSIHKTAKIERDWIDRQSTQELDDLVRLCYEETTQRPNEPVRIQLCLSESLSHAADDFTIERLRNYLDTCEQEIMDLTFFLDKSDAETMDIYKTYLLPESTEQMNSFLRDRCMMIYATSENLELDYHQEMEDFFQAIDIPMSPNFFEDFEQFKEQVFNSEEQDETGDGQLSEESEQESIIVPTMIEVSREEVENENILQINKFMEKALFTPEQARKYESSLLFSFYGFGRHEDLIRMMNRKEIKEWASILVEKHPYIFYFLNDEQYPMTKFLTSLVVTTEVEDQAVYYNEDELSDFRAFVSDALVKLADWIGQDKQEILDKFEQNFQE